MRKKIKYIILFMVMFLSNPKILLALNGAGAGGGKVTASGTLICDEKLRNLIIEYWGYIVVAAPILLIVMSTIEFLKAMSAGDSDALSKSISNTIKRSIATVILFLIPASIRLIFDVFGVGSSVCF